VCRDGGDAAASGLGGRYKLIIVNQNTAADTRDDCTLQSKQPRMHASYGLVKARLICYVGKMRMFTRIGNRIIPVVTSAHLHIRIIPRPLCSAIYTTTTTTTFDGYRGLGLHQFLKLCFACMLCFALRNSYKGTSD